MVDSSDRDRMGISKSELVAMLEVRSLLHVPQRLDTNWERKGLGEVTHCNVDLNLLSKNFSVVLRASLEARLSDSAEIH